jgi:hypothetical protein
MCRVVLVGVVLGVSQFALAEADGVAEPAQDAISLEVPALLSAGIELDGERFFAHHRWSLTFAVGGQWASGGDYSAQTYATGIEGRLWLNRLRLWFMPHLGGPYAGLRADVALSELLDHRISAATTGLAVAGSLTVGYRLVFFDRVEATPSVGVSLTSDVGTVPSVVFGVPLFAWHFGGTLGYLF